MTNVIEFITNLDEGGAESLVRDYALLLDDKRFNVLIVVMWPLHEDSPYVRVLREQNRRVVSIYPRKKMCKTFVGQKIWNRCIHDQFVKSRLLKIIKDNNVSVIHSHLEVLYYVKLVAKHIPNVKLFFTCHSMPKFIFKKTRWRNEKPAAQKLINHHNLRMIALHENMRAELNSMFNTDTTIVLPNGIDFCKYSNITETKTDIRETIGIPNDAFVVGHIGRFTEAKNHTKLVEIFEGVIKQQPSAYLLMIGTGELQEQTESLLVSKGLKGKYTILQKRNDIPRLLKAMDIFVFPSVFEGLPVTLVEAQVMGLRCLISTRVTEECFFSPEAVPLNVESPTEEWVNAVLDTSVKGNICNDINRFNMASVIEQLSNLYEGLYE